jgi:hypothetical protein
MLRAAPAECIAVLLWYAPICEEYFIDGTFAADVKRLRSEFPACQTRHDSIQATAASESANTATDHVSQGIDDLTALPDL